MSPTAAKATKNADFKPKTAPNPRHHPSSMQGQGFDGVQPRATGHEAPRLRLVTTTPDEPATTPPVASPPNPRPTPPSPSKPPRRGTIPSYRQRAGYDQAIVTLTDSRTGKRRDYWLGEFNSPQSREAYFRVIAEWEGMGRQLPDMQPVGDQGSGGGGKQASEQLLIAHIIRDYWKHIKHSHRKHTADSIRMSLRVLREGFGSVVASQFGPNSLRIVREAMVLGKHDGGEVIRKPWCRKTVNTRVGNIVRMFRWAASRELVSATVYQSLQTLEPLQRGRTAAVDHPKVGPVSLEQVEAVKPFVSRQVAALTDLQLLTGARPGELLRLRPSDIVMGSEVRLGDKVGLTKEEMNRKPKQEEGDGGVWTYTPEEHKNTYRGIKRVIYFGPKAQAILKPFMESRPATAYLFSPAEAVMERLKNVHTKRVTPMSCGTKPRATKLKQRQHSEDDHYTPGSYRRSIERACDLAFPVPEHLRPRLLPKGRVGPARRETPEELNKRLSPKHREELRTWLDEHRWHPNQLRHTAATILRRQFGLEVAQLVLGHSSAEITDAVYAERDVSKVAKAVRQVG